MSHYLIEFRFQGNMQKRIREIIFDLDKRFELGIRGRKRPVPHITFVGPIQTLDEGRLVEVFDWACRSFPLMRFKLKNFAFFDVKKIIIIKVQPDENMSKFRLEMAGYLRNFCNLAPFDHFDLFHFHVTILDKYDTRKFSQISEHMRRMASLEQEYTVLRVTLLKDARIFREYDFALERILNRSEALNRSILGESLKRLESLKSIGR